MFFLKIINRLQLIYNRYRAKYYQLQNELVLNRAGVSNHPIIQGKLQLTCFGTIDFGKNCIINSSHESNPVGLAERTIMVIDKGSSLLIGNNVGMSNCLIFAQSKITIGDDVLIGGGTQIFDTDFHSILYLKRMNNNMGIIKAPVYIKKGAFIGCNVIILKGVTIGENSVIGAGSVVRSSVPDNQIWAGNPATYLKSINQ